MTAAARGLGAALAVVALDHASKAWLLARHPLPGAEEALLPFLSLVHVRNTGAGFGLLASDSDAVRLALSGLALAVAAALLVWQARAPDRTAALGASLVAGGAVGNAIDRLWRGSVVDFIDVHAAGWHWPAFNAADSAITVGVVALLANSLPLGRVLARLRGQRGAGRTDR